MLPIEFVNTNDKTLLAYSKSEKPKRELLIQIPANSERKPPTNKKVMIENVIYAILLFSTTFYVKRCLNIAKSVSSRKLIHFVM